jgi:hypothetical protein
VQHLIQEQLDLLEILELQAQLGRLLVQVQPDVLGIPGLLDIVVILDIQDKLVIQDIQDQLVHKVSLVLVVALTMEIWVKQELLQLEIPL